MEDRPKGKPTENTTLIVCQCGGVAFSEEKRTKTAVVFRCIKCNERTSVQGRAAVARVPLDEVTFAIQHILAPEYRTDGEPKRPKLEVKQEWLDLFREDTENIDLDERNSLNDEQKELLDNLSTKEVEDLKLALNKREPMRFGFLPQDKYLINRWLNGLRIMHHGESGFAEQTWQSKALALAAADGLAGFPPQVLAVLDAVDEAVDRLSEEAKEKGKKWSKRKETRIRNDTRDALCQRYNLGVYADQTNLFEPKPDPVVEQAKAVEAKQADARAAEQKKVGIIDDGYLHRALMDVRESFGLQGVMLIGGPAEFSMLQKAADDKGGYLLRVEGDPRTTTKKGAPVYEYVWLEEDDEDDPVDFVLPYLEQIDDVLPDAQIRVVELLPSDYDELEPWDKPTIADEREILK